MPYLEERKGREGEEEVERIERGRSEEEGVKRERKERNGEGERKEGGMEREREETRKREVKVCSLYLVRVVTQHELARAANRASLLDTLLAAVQWGDRGIERANMPP